MLDRRSFLKSTVVVIGVTGFCAGDMSQAFAADKRVALIMTGSIADGSWNQFAHDGLMALKGLGGFEVAFAENVTQAKISQVVQGYADDGYDLIIGHGFEFGSAFIELAPQYPDQKFFASTFKPSGDVPKNTRYIDLAYFDAAYAAGALAGLISTSGKSVGFVGGGDNPTQQRMMKCFIAGAEAARPGLKATGIITGDYDNAARGKEAAGTMAANGADVIWSGANVTGLGAIQGAVSSGAKVIGVYSDQSNLAPGKMATSVTLNLDWMVMEVAKSVADQSFKGGEEWQPKVTEMWTLKSGTQGDHDPAVVDDATWATFAKLWHDLGERSIDVAKLVP